MYIATCPECLQPVAWASSRLTSIQHEVECWAMEGLTISESSDYPEQIGHSKTCQRVEPERKPKVCTECGKEAGSVYREIARRKVCMSCNPFHRCNDCGGLLEHKGTPNWMNCFQCVECGKKVSR